MEHLAYGFLTAFFVVIGYEIGKLVIGSIKDKLNGEN
jgi:hypothetical protein